MLKAIYTKKQNKPRHDFNATPATVGDHGDFNQDQQYDLPNDSLGKHASVQTDLDVKSLTAFMTDCRSRVVEKSKQKNTFSIYEKQYYVEDEAKVTFYTGLPSPSVMDLIFNFIKDYISNKKIALFKEKEFLMCLNKIRMNYLFQDMAYQLNV